MSSISLQFVQDRIQQIEALPTMPSILLPLVRCLEQPLETIDVHRVVELISHDEGLAAQCLKMANSPLFARTRAMDTIRGAVVSLGIARVRDIALTCCMANVLSSSDGSFDPVRFWEHSLGVALVCRRLSRRIGFRDPERAYLAGLLHDIGIIVSLQTVPKEFNRAYKLAVATRRPMDEVERELLGFNHCVGGELLAIQWKLSADNQDVIRNHHDPSRVPVISPMLGIVNIADLLCRTAGLDYGYPESLNVDLSAQPAWQALSSAFSSVKTLDLTQFARDIDSYATEVRSLVSVLFRIKPL
jgi:HD-like signal output (HDOD) protein